MSHRWLAWQCIGIMTALCVCCIACVGPSTPTRSVGNAPAVAATATPTQGTIAVVAQPTKEVTATPTTKAAPTATHAPTKPPAPPPPAPTATQRPAPVPTATTGASNPNQDFINRAIARTNSYRQQNGCAPVTENAQLDQAALSHSQDMAVSNYFAHNSPAGQTPWDRMHTAGYQFTSAAENIAAGYSTPESVIDAFYNEQPPNDGHRRNLLNCGLHEVGIGYYAYANSTYKTYWTQDLGTR